MIKTRPGKQTNITKKMKTNNKNNTYNFHLDMIYKYIGNTAF